LARPADRITVGEVIAYIESKQKKKETGKGAFEDLWKSVDAAISAVVDHTTFADLVRKWRESQARYVPNWEI